MPKIGEEERLQRKLVFKKPLSVEEESQLGVSATGSNGKCFAVFSLIGGSASFSEKQFVIVFTLGGQFACYGASSVARNGVQDYWTVTIYLGIWWDSNRELI